MKCSKCRKKEAIFFRKYSGQALCKGCFIKSIYSNVRHTISKYDMLMHDDRIAVAVSGGKDSVSLLHILSKIEEKFPKSELIAITVDEGIEGYRSAALSIAKENCNMLNIEHFVISFRELYGYNLDDIVKVARERKGYSPCAICGVLRRKALNIAVREIGATKLATAHNLDDELQTFLMNLVQGNLTGIARLKPKTEPLPGFVSRIKPLYRIPESEIALFAFLKHIEFQPYPCTYAHEAMREEARSILNRLELNHPGAKFMLLKSMERITSLIKEENLKPKRCKLCNEPCARDVCRACEILSNLGLL